MISRSGCKTTNRAISILAILKTSKPFCFNECGTQATILPMMKLVESGTYNIPPYLQDWKINYVKIKDIPI